MKKAVSSAENIRPITAAKTVTVKVTYYRSDMCEGTLAGKTDIERVDARTLRKMSITVNDFANLKI